MKGGNQVVIRDAGVMGSAIFLSRILGLVREQVFAFFFGAGSATDAFQVAFRIPNLLRDLFAEGAMSAALVPVFTKTRVKEGAEAAWRLAGLVFRTLAITVVLLSILGFIFSAEIVALYASAFREVPGKFELAVRLTRWMIPFFPCVVLAAAFMAVLNSCGVYFIPALGSAVFNFTSILVGLSLFSFFKDPIEGMAVGVMAGGFFQCVCQFPSLFKVGYRWVPQSKGKPWYQDQALKQILVLMIPGTIGLASTQINILVNTILATQEEVGAVSWLNYAFRLMYFPIGLFGVSVSAALLPKISTHWAKGDFLDFRDSLQQGLRFMFAINLPASAGLFFLGVPVIELIFQYGQFNSTSTFRTADALGMYSLGLVAYSAIKILVPACYAMGKTRQTVIASVVSTLAVVIFNIITVSKLGFRGLALGTSLGAYLNVFFLMMTVRSGLRKQGVQFSILPLVKICFLIATVSILMGWICRQTYELLVTRLIFEFPIFHSSFLGIILNRGLSLGLVIIEGIIFIGISALLIGMSELKDALQFLVSKMRKFAKRS